MAANKKAPAKTKAKPKTPSKKPAAKRKGKASAAAGADERKQSVADVSAQADQAPDAPPMALEDLPFRYRLFVEEYAIDGNGTRATIAAGFSPNGARAQACRLLARPEIRWWVDALMEDRVEAARMTRERVLADIEALTAADANELAEHRRVNCRYCWGKDFKYQRTQGEYDRDMAEWAKEVHKAEVEGKAPPPPFDEMGGVGFRRNGDPNPECPECCGEGVGEVFFKDTRKASRRARLLYAGAKVGKDGWEIKMHSVDKAREMLAKHHKIYEDRTEVTLNLSAEDLEQRFAARMAAARKRQEEVARERGLESDLDDD